jgi:hypothetical protein
MSSHHHHPGSAGGAAPGSQPAHPGNATRRAAAVTRQTPATSQAGRSASPGRDMNARSGRPHRAQRSPAASLRSGLRRQTASARPRNWTAAQCIIETPERPAPRPAINPGRPLTLSQLPTPAPARCPGVRARPGLDQRNGREPRYRQSPALAARRQAQRGPDPRRDHPPAIPPRPDRCPPRPPSDDPRSDTQVPRHQDRRLRPVRGGACPPPPDHPRDVRRRRTADRPRRRIVRSEPGCLRRRLPGRGKGQAMNRPEDLAVPPPRSKGCAS